MKRSNEAILEKMIEYCIEVENFVNGYTYDEFVGDIKTYRATTQNLMLIGELAYVLPKELKVIFSNIDWYGIAGLRHRLVHDYEDINDVLLWDIAKNEAPQLIVDLQKVLENDVFKK